MKIHHVEKFKELEKGRYVNGLVAYVDGFDIDQFSIHELNVLMEEFGYVNDDPIYYHYMIPGTDLDIGLRALGNDLDVLGLAKYIKDNKLIMVYREHIDTKPSMNEQEKYTDDNYEPVETLVEGKTLAEDEEDSGLEEGDSDSEDDEDYFVDEDKVEWVRHSNSGQQQDHDPIPCELDVIDNDYFDSGTDSEDDGIEKIRINKL
ncbi:hypothetical protein Tco_0809580 [Tanacetum coccineum]